MRDFKEMTSQSKLMSETMTSAMASTLSKIAVKYNDYVNACRGVQTYYSDVKITEAREILQEYLQDYLEKKVDAANERTLNRSTSEIKVNDLPEPYDRFLFPHNIEDSSGKSELAYKADIETLIEYLYVHWDETAIDQALVELERTIEIDGFANAAVSVGCDLMELLTRDSWQDRGPVSVKKQKGKIVFKVNRLYGNGYGIQQRVHDLIGHLEAIEAETGATGTAETFKEYLRVLVLNNQCGLGSGTKFTTNEKCHITTYNNHLNLHLEPEMFESIYSFVNEYTPDGYIIRTIDS